MWRSEDVEEREQAIKELNNNFAILEDKKQAWDDLERLLRDNRRSVRRDASDALGVSYSHIPEDNKKRAWDDLIMFTRDNNDSVRRDVAYALGVSYFHVPDEYRKQAWDDLHRLMQDDNDFVRRGAAEALGVSYSYIPEEYRKRAWDDLHRLTQDRQHSVRRGAADALGVSYFHMPEEYRKQAWDYLHRLTQDKNYFVRIGAADALGVSYSHIPEEHRKQAWDDLHKLTQENNDFVRIVAAYTLGGCYPHIPKEYRKHAWDDLHRLTQYNNDSVRRGVADTLGVSYPHIPGEYRKQAWDDLHRLRQDKDAEVRVAANHSSGRVSIYRASQAKDDESVRKELETALRFFEKSSNESTCFNPAKFCLPFYRSFHAIIFEKENAESEVEKYIAEAKSAVAGSENKEKLLEVVKNLGNALKEAQKARDFNDTKTDLNACRRYLDRACELLETTEEKAPGASRLIMKGLPIIDERIKGIIAEINEKAKALCKKTKGTKYESLGKEVVNAGESASKVRDPIGLEKAVGNLEIAVVMMCNEMPEGGGACKLLKKANEEEFVEDKINLLNMAISQMSSQMNKNKDSGNIEIHDSENVQIVVGEKNHPEIKVNNNIETHIPYPKYI